MRAWILALIGLCGAALMAAHPAAAADACAPEGRVHFVCGPVNAEDLARVPGTPFLVVSGMSEGGKAGALYLVDTAAKTFEALQVDLSGPAREPYQQCPTAPSTFAAHGLALRPGTGGKSLLYAVNHGGRQSVELLEIDASSGKPKAAWVGCVVMPPDSNPNSVAPTPDGGFVVTKFDDDDKTGFPAMAEGKVTGAVYAWAPGLAIHEVAASRFSGDNGIEVSPDGRWIFVNAWPEHRVVRLDRRGHARQASAKVDFMPDNIHWGPDGRLLVTGQASDMKTLLSCTRPHCPHDWAVVRLDPKTMAVTPLVRETGTEGFSDATGALQVGNELWVGTYRGDRLAYEAVK